MKPAWPHTSSWYTRSWAIIVAATNFVRTATAASGMPDLSAVLYPERGATPVAHAWHYLLGALDSGYMYYGDALDMELKPVVASNQAVAEAQKVLGPGVRDTLGPTVCLPQRYPDNPGGLNFGPLYQYKQVMGAPDFWVWTFAADVSGVAGATLKVRVDADGVDPLGDDTNETYPGGPGVGPWRSLPMTRRAFPTDNPLDDPNFDTSILPTVIADEFYVQVSGYRNVLLDYYVEATDTLSQVSRTPIQHVAVGDPHGPAVIPPGEGDAPDGGVVLMADAAHPHDGGGNRPATPAAGCTCQAVPRPTPLPRTWIWLLCLWAAVYLRGRLDLRRG